MFSISKPKWKFDHSKSILDILFKTIKIHFWWQNPLTLLARGTPSRWSNKFYIFTDLSFSCLNLPVIRYVKDCGNVAKCSRDFQTCQSQIIFFISTFKLKININNTFWLISQFKTKAIPKIFKVLSSEDRATAIYTHYL